LPSWTSFVLIVHTLKLLQDDYEDRPEMPDVWQVLHSPDYRHRDGVLSGAPINYTIFPKIHKFH
jgi:hypothetical protein